MIFLVKIKGFLYYIVYLNNIFYMYIFDIKFFLKILKFVIICMDFNVWDDVLKWNKNIFIKKDFIGKKFIFFNFYVYMLKYVI